MAMNGWAIAIIVIVIVILLILVLVAIFATPSCCSTASSALSSVNRGAERSSSDVCTNLTLTVTEWASQTSNFIQQARTGYKGIGVTFGEMNRLSDEAGEIVAGLKGKQVGERVAELMRDKNDLYKAITGDILINRESLSANSHLIQHLNKNSVQLAEVLALICDANTKDVYVKALHEYDIAVVKQINAINSGNYEKYLAYSKVTQKKSLELAMTICYCPVS